MTETKLDGEPKRGPGRPPKLPPTVTPMADAPEGVVVEAKMVLNDPPTLTNAPPVKLIPVKLLKNYWASGAYEIVEAAPSPVPGVSFATKDKAGNETGRKLWANTVVALPRDEVARLLNNEVTELETVEDGDGKPARKRDGSIIRHARTKKFPLAERADPLPG